METAKNAAKLSFAQRSKVGAILVKDGRIISTGFNGQPMGFDNCCEYTDENGILVTKPTVIHAEANCIYFCAKNGIKTDGTTLYITLSPCKNCALAIIQAGIKKVYYDELYRDDSPLKLLKSSGIDIIKI